MRRVSDAPAAQQAVLPLARGSTPPPELVLDDPSRGPFFLFHVAASHGAPLRADQVFVTKELFFRLFIESGVAATVSSFSSKKKTQQQQGGSGGNDAAGGGGGGGRSESPAASLRSRDGKKKSLKSFLSSRSMSMRAGQQGGGGAGAGADGESLQGGNNNNDEDDADELEEDIRSRLPSCWSTPPVSYALLYRLWNENCSKEHFDTMFFEGFQNALTHMIDRAQGIYEAHFKREQELRKSLVAAAQSEQLSFRLLGGSSVQSRRSFLVSPTASSMRLKGRSMSLKNLTTQARRNSAGTDNSVATTQRVSPRVVTIQEEGDGEGDARKQQQQQQPVPVPPAAVAATNETKPPLSDKSDATPKTAVATEQNNKNNNGNKPPLLDSTQLQQQVAQAANALAGAADDDDKSTNRQSNDSSNAQQQKQNEDSEPTPSLTGGRDHLSSILEAFCASCCHDTVTSILTVQSLHNGTSGLSDTTVEVLLAAFAKHSALLRFLFRTGVHMEQLRQIREREREKEEERKRMLAAQQQQQQTSPQTGSGLVSGSGTLGSGSGAGFGSLPQLLPSVSQLPPTPTLSGQLPRQRRNSTPSSFGGTSGGKATAATELLAATMFDHVCKNETVRAEFMERAADDCYCAAPGASAAGGGMGSAAAFGSSTSTFSGTASRAGAAANNNTNNTTRQQQQSSFDNISAETIVWLLSSAGAAEYSTHGMFLPEKGYTELLRTLRIYPQLLSAEMVECFFLSTSHEDTRDLARQNATPVGEQHSGNNATISGSMSGLGGGTMSFLQQQLQAQAERQNTPPTMPTPRGTPEPGALRPEACFEFDEFVDFVFSLAVAIFGDRGSFPRHVTVQAAVLSTLALLEACTVRYVVAPLAQFASHLAQLIERSDEANRKVKEHERLQQQQQQQQQPGKQSSTSMFTDRSPLAGSSSSSPTSPGLGSPISPLGQQQQQQQHSPPQEIKLRRSHFAVLQSLAQQGIDAMSSTAVATSDAEDTLKELLTPDESILCARLIQNRAILGQQELSGTFSSAGGSQGVAAPQVGPNFFGTINNANALLNANATQRQMQSSAARDHQLARRELDEEEVDGSVGRFNVSGFNKKRIMLNANMEPTVRDMAMPGFNGTSTAVGSRRGGGGGGGGGGDMIALPVGVGGGMFYDDRDERARQLGFSLQQGGGGGGGGGDSALASTLVKDMLMRRSFGVGVLGATGSINDAGAQFMSGLEVMNTAEFEVEMQDRLGLTMSSTKRTMNQTLQKEQQPKSTTVASLQQVSPPSQQYQDRLAFSTTAAGRLKLLQQTQREGEASASAGEAAPTATAAVAVPSSCGATAGQSNAMSRWRAGLAIGMPRLFEQGDDVPVSKNFTAVPAGQQSKNGTELSASATVTRENTGALVMSAGTSRPGTAFQQQHMQTQQQQQEQYQQQSILAMSVASSRINSAVGQQRNQEQKDQQHQQQQQPSSSAAAAASMSEMVDSMLVPEIWAVLPKVVRLTASEPQYPHHKRKDAAPTSPVTRSTSGAGFGLPPTFTLPAGLIPNSAGGGGPLSTNTSFANPSQPQQQQTAPLRFRENTNLFISCWNLDCDPPAVSITSSMDDLNMRRDRDAQLARVKKQQEDEERREKERREEAERKRRQEQGETMDELLVASVGAGSTTTTTTTKSGFGGMPAKAGSSGTVSSLAVGLKSSGATTRTTAAAAAATGSGTIHRSEYGNAYSITDDENGQTPSSNFSMPTLQAMLHFRTLVRTFRTEKETFSDFDEQHRWHQLIRNIGRRATQELFGRFDPRFVLDQCLANGIEGLQSFVRAQCNPLMFHSEDELVEMNFKKAVEKSRTSILVFGLRPGTNVRDPDVRPMGVSALATRRNRLYCANLAAGRIRTHFRGSALVNVVSAPRPSRGMQAVNSTGRDFVPNLEDRGLEDLPPRAVEFLQSMFLQCSWVYRLDVAGGKSASSEENTWLGPPQHCIAVEVPPAKPAVVKVAVPPRFGGKEQSAAAVSAPRRKSLQQQQQQQQQSKNESSSGAPAAAASAAEAPPPPQQLTLPWNSNSAMTMPASVGLKRALFHFFSRWGTKRRPTPPEPPKKTPDISILGASPDAERQSSRGRNRSRRRGRRSRSVNSAAPNTDGAAGASSSRAASPLSPSVVGAQSVSTAAPHTPRSLGSTLMGNGSPTNLNSTFLSSASSRGSSRSSSKKGRKKKKKKKQEEVKERVILPERPAKLDEADFHWHISRGNFVKWADSVFAATGGCSGTKVPLSELALVKSAHVDRFAGAIDPECILGATSRVSLVELFDFFASSCGATEKALARFDICREAQKMHAASITAQSFCWEGPFFTLEDGAMLELPGKAEVPVPPMAPDHPLNPDQQQQRKSVVLDSVNALSSSSSVDGAATSATPVRGNVSFLGGSQHQQRQLPRASAGASRRDSSTSASSSRRGSPLRGSSRRGSSAQNSKEPKLTRKQRRELRKAEAEQKRQEELAEQHRLMEEQYAADLAAYIKKYNINDADDTVLGLSAHAFLSLLGVVAAQMPSAAAATEEAVTAENEDAARLGREASCLAGVVASASDPLDIATPRSTKTKKVGTAAAQSTSTKKKMSNSNKNKKSEQAAQSEKSAASDSAFPTLPSVQVVNARLQVLLEKDLDPSRTYKRKFYQKARQIDLNLAGDVAPLLPKKMFKPKPPSKLVEQLSVANKNVTPASFGGGDVENRGKSPSQFSTSSARRREHQQRHRHDYPAASFTGHKSQYRHSFPAPQLVRGEDDDDYYDHHHHHHHRGGTPPESFSRSSSCSSSGSSSGNSSCSNSSFDSSNVSSGRLYRESRNIDAKDARLHDSAFDELYLAQRDAVGESRQRNSNSLAAKIVQHQHHRREFDSRQTQLMHALDPDGEGANIPHPSQRCRVAHRAKLAEVLLPQSSAPSSAATSRAATPRSGAMRRRPQSQQQQQRPEQKQQQHQRPLSLLVDDIDESHPVFNPHLLELQQQDKQHLVEDPKWRDEGRKPVLEPVHRLCRGRYGAQAAIAEAMDDTAEISAAIFLSKQQKVEQRANCCAESQTQQMCQAVRMSDHEELAGCVMPESPRMREIKKEQHQQQHFHNLHLWGQGVQHHAGTAAAAPATSRNSSRNSSRKKGSTAGKVRGKAGVVASRIDAGRK